MAEGIRAKCDFCGEPAAYDGKTTMGPWAYMCHKHWKEIGTCVYTKLESSDTEPKKVCRICGTRKPVSAFYKYTDHTGTTRYRSECIACNLKRRRMK